MEACVKLFALLALLVSGLAFAAQSVPRPLYKEGELLLKQDSTVTTRDLLETLSHQIGAQDGGAVSPRFPDWRKILLPKGTVLEDAMKFLRGVKGVAHVEPNYLYYASAVNYDYVPTDKKFKDQWGLFNFGQKIQGQTAEIGADINILGAWNFRKGAQNAAKNVVVAIVDSGVTWNHPDLAQNVWQNPGEASDKAHNGKDDDGNGFIDDFHGWDFTSVTTGGNPQQYNGDNDPSDGLGHGTHVAGIIGAAHNGIGISGINAEVQLMPVKFIGNDGSGSLEFAVRAIAYAVDNGADVINASWGGPGLSDLLHEAVAYANGKGVLFVAAAGNDSLDNDQNESYPANFPEVFSVVASDDKDRIASFSNTGRQTTHITAPGVNILSTFKPMLLFNNQYAWLSGTSMATPQVVGVAAMLIGMYPDKFKRDPDAIKRRIMDSSDIQPGLLPRTLSGGRMNAYNAVAGITTPGHYPLETLSWNLKVPVTIESAHPYENASSAEWKISQPGAKWIRLNFGRFSMEYVNDYVELRDSNDRLIDVLTGFGTAAVSRPIQGEEVHVKFVSNGHVTGWGFELKGYEVVQ
jgi:hypothetical protein